MKRMIADEFITGTCVWGKWLLPVIVALGLLMANTSTAWADDDDDDDDGGDHDIVGTWRVTGIFNDEEGNVVGTVDDYAVFHEDGTFVETSAGPANISAGVGLWESIDGNDEGDDDDDDGNGNLYALTFEVFTDTSDPLDGIADNVIQVNATILVQGDTWSATVSGPLLSLDGEDVIVENALAGTTAIARRIFVVPE